MPHLSPLPWLFFPRIVLAGLTILIIITHYIKTLQLNVIKINKLTLPSLFINTDYFQASPFNKANQDVPRKRPKDGTLKQLKRI